MSKRGKNFFFFPFFLLLSSSFCQISTRNKRNYGFCRLAYENQVCIRQIERKNVIGIWVTFNMMVCSARLSLWWLFKILKNLTLNNFISVDFQTHVAMWFLISMKFYTRIINKKGEYESAIAPWSSSQEISMNYILYLLHFFVQRVLLISQTSHSLSHNFLHIKS